MRRIYQSMEYLFGSKKKSQSATVSTGTYSNTEPERDAREIKREYSPVHMNGSPMHISDQSSIPDMWSSGGKENMSMTRDELDDSRGHSVTFQSSSAKLKAGTVNFDDVNDDFMNADVDTFRDTFEPPHVVDLQDDELQKILDFERKRLNNKKRLLDDPMYWFIVNVSGGTNINLERILPQSTVGAYDRNAPVRYSPYSGSRGGGGGSYATDVAMRNPVSPGAHGLILNSPPPSRRGKAGGKTGAQPAARQPLRQVGNFGGVDEAALRLAEEELEERKAENRYRLSTGYPWVEKIEVMGQMTLSPKIYFAANEAFTTIRGVDQLYSYKKIADFHALIYANLIEIRTLFADLTRLYIADTDFLFPTRTPLDKNGDRINQKIWVCLTKFARFEWLPNEERFRDKSVSYSQSLDQLLLKKM